MTDTSAVSSLPLVPQAILRPGDTCWRIEKADRLSVIIDAADYFACVKAAIKEAKHSVLLIGWDFDTRVVLDPEDDSKDVPDTLGAFLMWMIDTRPGLHVHVLKWGLGWVKSLGRGSTPLVILDWMSHKRIRFRLDHTYQTSSVHHQKVVVIDDAIAFCGGIDITADRWDTREHLDDDPRRKRPTSGRSYGPWHDVATAVDGDAARALGDLARERWKRATGETLTPPPAGVTIWPDRISPSLENVDVAISRTAPAWRDEKGIYEIEKLYLAVIASTERSLYIESQYFASRKIAEAMAARLREPDGPEIVVVNPETADGWLEEEAMGSARAGLLRLIEESDTHDRFRIYTPVAAKGTPIYVHAKVLIMDDRLLRVGSSNLNNRSLGFDAESDLSVELHDDPARQAQIIALRSDLLAEHLDVTPPEIEAAVGKAGGSLIGAIEALRGEGRTLVPFEPPELNAIQENLIRESPLLDPERPAKRRTKWRVTQWLRRVRG